MDAKPRGTVAETVAINPAFAINGIKILNQWYYFPAYLAIMADCANTSRCRFPHRYLGTGVEGRPSGQTRPTLSARSGSSHEDDGEIEKGGVLI